MKRLWSSGIMLGLLGALPNLSAEGVTALKVTSISATPGLLHIALKNEAPLGVRGFCMSAGPGSFNMVQFFPPRAAAIAPGASYSTDLAISDGSDSGSFAITCIMLDDGLIEGSDESAEAMKRFTAGSEYQVRRLLPLLDNVGSSDNANLGAAIRKAVESIKTMGLTLEDGTQATGLFANGVRSTSNHLMNELLRAESYATQFGDITRARKHLELLASEHRITGAFLKQIHKR